MLWDSGNQNEASASQRLMKLVSAICVPLKYGQRLHGELKLAGVIYVDALGLANALGEPELRLLTALAEVAGVAFENAKIFENTESERALTLRLKENVAKLYEVGKSLASTLVLDDLLVAVVDHVVSVAQGERGFVMLLEHDQDGTKQVVFKVGRDAEQADSLRGNVRVLDDDRAQDDRVEEAPGPTRARSAATARPPRCPWSR